MSDIVVPFTEKFKWQRRIVFSGLSFVEWAISVLPMAKGLTPGESWRDNGIKVGDYWFYLKPLLKYTMEYPFPFARVPRKVRAGLDIFKGSQHGTAYFDKPIFIPVLCDKYGVPWMSLTPNEVLTQRNQVRRAGGHVGVGGFGLGWNVRRMLEKPRVKSVTVVERCPDVLRVFGEPLKQEFGDRLQLVNADVREYDWVRFDSIIWDIWMTHGAASRDKHWQKLKKELLAAEKVCVGWGDLERLR